MDLRFGEGEDKFFLVLWEDEGGEGLGVEGDFGDGVDEEGEPAFGFEGVPFEQGSAVEELLFGERNAFYGFAVEELSVGG